MKKQINGRKQNGFSILEVVIGIFIFMVGMLALAALQGALTRSMADSKLRTTAANIADRVIERQRGFTQLRSTAGTPFAYNDIPVTDETVDVNGVTYTIDMNVKDYYYQLSADTLNVYAFCTTGDTDCPTGATSSDYKQVAVTVSWGSGLDFRGDEGEVVTAANLGTGSITLTGVISALITSASARVADESTGGAAAPIVSYSPSEDLISISLGDQKFKVSSQPEPKVLSKDGLVQTTFDVITYSQSGGNQFIRREEFAAVSCKCRFVTGSELARRPVIWAGDEYSGGHLVNKPYGESASNQQSSLCDSCCRDHHDGGVTQTGDSVDIYSNVYGPFRADEEYLIQGQAGKKSDHEHYLDVNAPAVTSGDYLEACRLVRVDGFFRVAQDFRREDQYVFPEDFLDNPADPNDTETGTYSSYVTNAVTAYKDSLIKGYPTNSPPCIGFNFPSDPSLPDQPDLSCVAQPNMPGYPNMQGYPLTIVDGELPSWTLLKTGGVDDQQLTSRGIYIDYMSDDLRATLLCLDNPTNTAEDCERGDVKLDRTGSTNILEVLPFFEVQMTKLDSWDQDPDTLRLTSDGVESFPTKYSRGAIKQKETSKKDPALRLGEPVVKAESHRGNIGFTDTYAIDPEFSRQLKHANLTVQSLDNLGSLGDGVPIAVHRFEGAFAAPELNGTPAIKVVGGGDAHCGLKPGGYWCEVAVGVTVEEPTVTIYGYEDILDPDDETDVLEPRCAFSDSLLPAPILLRGPSGETNATFSLLDSLDFIVPDGTTYNISIEATVCPTGGFGT